MSDNPNSEDLAKLGFEVDESSAQKAVESFQQIDEAAKAEEEIFALLNATMDESAAKIDLVSQSMNQINESVAQSTEEAGTLRDSWADVKGIFDNLNDTLDHTSDSFANLQAAAPKQGYTPGLTQPQDIGYGQAGGLIGPAEGEDDGSGGGGGGSLFGAAHGIRAASGLASLAGIQGGSAAFTGTADVLYLTKGLQSLSDIIPNLNTAIEASIADTGSLGAAFVALDIPMAGLLAVGAPVVVAIAAMAVAISHFLDILKQGVADVQAATNALSDYNQDVNNLTKEEVQQKLAAAQDQAKGYQDTIDTLQTKGTGLELDRQKTKDPVQAAADLAGEKALSDQIDAQQKLLDTANGKIQTYNSELTNQTLINDSASTTIRNQTDAMIAQQAQFAKDDEMTSAAAKKHSDEVSADAVTQAQAIAILQASNAEKGISNQEQLKNNEAIAQHQDALAKDQAEMEHLTQTSIPLITAREQEAAVIKETTTDLNDINKAAQDFGKAVQSAQDQYAQSVTDGKQKELQAEQQYIQGSLQDTEARLKIATDESRQETQIKQQEYQQLADLGTKLSENDAAANQAFDRQQQDDQTKYAANRQKLIQTEADTEQADLQSHLQKLADIQNKQQNDNQQALLDRNFLQLAKNKESGSQAVDQENERYAQQEDNLKTHLAQQERDQDQAEAQLEAQQRVALSRKIQDLQTAYDQQELQDQTAERRKIEDARTAERTKEQDLVTSETYQIELLRQGLATELDLYRQQEQQRIAIAEQTQDTIIAKATASLQQLGQTGAPQQGRAGGISQFANGGDFASGQPFIMSEGGAPENLNIGGGSSQINGAALVYPLQSGSVTPQGGNKQPISLTNNWNISGNNNAEQIVSLAVGKMQDMLEGLMT